MVGHSNQSEIIVNGHHCQALIDSGSMVTTVSESFFNSLVPPPELLTLEDFALDISGANDSKLPYKGYSLLSLSVPSLESSDITVPVLVVPDTDYSARVPLLVGTNVIRHLHTHSIQTNVPSCWQQAFSAISCVQSVPVKAFIRKPFTIKPYQTCTVTGKVRNVGEVTLGVTETLDCSHYLNVCPRVVNVRPGKNFSRIPVRICNLSARPVVINPRSVLCSLKEVEVVRSIDPSECLVPKSHNQDKTLEELGITVPSENLSPDEFSQASEFLNRWKYIFSSGLTDLGCSSVVEHKIELSDPTPFKEPYRRIPPGMFEEVREHIKEMLKAGAIRPSHSPFSSNIVLVRKKDGSLRFCIDFRRLNKNTVKDAYALPRIDETIDCLAGSRYFSKLDLRSGYWQVPLRESDKPKTAFTVGPLGFYECERMAFGLTNAPATFQRLMERCMGELNLKDCLIYLDDVIIFSDTIQTHFQRLEAVFTRLEQYGLKLKGSKCEFFQLEVKYLGHVVSADGVRTDPDKISVLKDWPVPRSIKDLRSFLGFAGYYRRFVEGFSQIAKPLNSLLIGHPTNKKCKSNKAATSWSWGPEQQKAFETIIEKLTSAPVLTYANYSEPFILNIDASILGLGAVLYQKVDGVERVVAYASRGLRPNERNYPAHKLEFLSLKWAIVDKLHEYLYGNQFLVRTDNNPLTYVFTSAKLDAQSHRWLAALSAYQFTIQYRSGKHNVDADALSRLPGIAKTDCGETKVLYPEVLKALFQATLADVCELPAVECIAVSQEVLDASSSEDIEVGTSLSDINWQAEQSNDPSISRVISIVKAGHKLTSRQSSHESDLVRQYLREWNTLFMKDGVLYRNGTVSGHPVVQLVAPSVLHDVIFSGLHDDAGHQGRDRTLSLIKSRFYWPGLDHFVDRRVRECPRCIRRKTPVGTAAPLVSVESTYPLELVCMDYLSLEMSSGGYEHILVITDHFTHYAQAIPTKNQTAHTTAKILFEQFICHYGFPSRLHSDQGRNFESAVIQELCKLANIEKSRTTPYHPQGNGMPERFNQTLLNMLGTLEDSEKSNWKAHIPALVHAYNSTKHESTGLTPHFLMFGRHPRLAIDAFLGIKPEDSERSKSHSNYVKGLQKRLNYAYKVASRESRRQARRHKRRYDLRVRHAKIEPGDRVLVRNVGLKGKNKLADRWSREVYVVCSQPNPDVPVFLVKKEHGRGLPRTVHRNLLLPFMGLPLRSSKPDISDPVEQLPAGPSDVSSETKVTDSQKKVSDDSPSVTVPLAQPPSQKYVIPARRKSKLNPDAEPFYPSRPVRNRRKPKWLISPEWVT